MNILQKFAERIPDRRSIRNVLAVIVVLVYSWSLLVSFYELPSWLYFMNLGDILSAYAYSLALDLVDSLMFLLLVLLLEVTLFLPIGEKRTFQSRAIILVLVLFCSLGLRLILFNSYDDIGVFIANEFTWWIFVFLVGMLLCLLLPKIGWINRALESLADRAVLFLYIYFPMSMISLLVVAIRNLS